jgi:hypothetical protein
MATAARFLADGTLAVAYAQSVSAYQWDVVQARKSPSGTLTETSRTRVSTGGILALKIQASPRNAADIVVSWNTVEPGFQGEAYTVQRSSDFGATWVTPVTLSLPGHSIWGDNIEWNSTGDLVLVGESHEDATSLSTVISTRLLRNSNAWSTPREISESDFDSYGKTEVSADGTMVSLIWRRNKIDAYSDTFAVLFIVSRDGGATWSSPQPVVDPEQDIDRWTSRLSVDPRSNIWTLEYLPADETTFLSTTLTLSTPTPPHVRPPVTTPTTDGSTASSSRDSGQSLNTSAPEPSPLPGATGTPDSTPTADPGLEAEPPTGTGGGFNPTLPLIVFIGMIGLAALAASAVWLVRFMRR